MSEQLNTMDIKEIMSFLPHRYPFLLIDRVLDYTPGETLHAIKNVTINEPFFQGHFPGSTCDAWCTYLRSDGTSDGSFSL